MPTRGEPFAPDPARSALLVVDMQNDFVREGPPQEVAQTRLVTRSPPPGLDGHSNGAEQIAVRARDGVGFLTPCRPAWTGWARWSTRR
jgi:hypothetical protein